MVGEPDGIYPGVTKAKRLGSMGGERMWRSQRIAPLERPEMVGSVLLKGPFQDLSRTLHRWGCSLAAAFTTREAICRAASKWTVNALGRSGRVPLTPYGPEIDSPGRCYLTCSRWKASWMAQRPPPAVCGGLLQMRGDVIPKTPGLVA